MSDFSHFTPDYGEAEDFANAVQDELMKQATEFHGTSPEMLARESYDVVMKLLGHPVDDEDE